MDFYFSWLGVVQEKIFLLFPRWLRFVGIFFILCASLAYFTKSTFSVWYSYDSIYTILSKGVWSKIGWLKNDDYPSLNLIIDFLFRDVSSPLEKFYEEATQFSSLLSGGVVTFFLGFCLWRAKLARGWHSIFYTMSMLSFFIASLICYISFNFIMISSYKDDLIYFANKEEITGGSKYSKLPLVVEFIIESESDLDDFKEIIIKGDVLNVFVSPQSIYALEQCGLLDNYMSFIKSQKEKLGIKIFADIEFQYKDISLLNQLALASSRSLPWIYKTTYDYAVKLKDNYCVDYVLGPVLDRRVALSDQTIGRRSFGQDHRVVIPSALATILGFQDANIMCIPKHFPGYPQNMYRNDNRHIKLNMTRYIDQGLQMNAAPFSYVYSHPALDVGGFLTDFIIVPSISSYLPYPLHHTTNLNKSGTYLAREKFSSIANDVIFITDDIMMLLYGAIDKPKRSITNNSMLLIDKLHKEINNHIHANRQYLANKRSDISNVSDVIALLSRSAFLSGNSLVLIRSQNPSSVQRIVGTVYHFSVYGGLSERISEINKQLEAFYRKKIKKHNDYSLHYNADNIGVPFIKLSSSSFIDTLKVSSLRENFSFCYFSSCISRDDIAPLFNISPVINNKELQQFNIYTESYGNRNKSKIAKNFTEYLQKTNYDYYIFVLSNDWQAESLDTLIKFLNSNNSINKLILFIAETPDYLSYLSRLFSFNVLDLMHSANIYCIFSNSYSVFSILNYNIKRDDLSFGDFQAINSTPIDLPNYFYNNYSSIDFDTNNQFDKIVSPHQFSSIVTNYNILMHFYPMYLFFLVLSFLSFGAGLVYHYIINKKDT